MKMLINVINYKEKAYLILLTCLYCEILDREIRSHVCSALFTEDYFVCIISLLYRL